jgi:hypothetical protein
VEDKPDAQVVATAARPTPSQVAARSLRDEAAALCARHQFVDCLIDLDKAKDLDPEGDDAPEVLKERRAATEGIRGDDRLPQRGSEKNFKPGGR